MRMTVDQARHRRAPAAVNHSGATASLEALAHLLDPVALDQHVLTHGQLVSLAVEDIDIREQGLMNDWFILCKRHLAEC